jgi:uncharacterized protein (TIGR03435 family)
MLSERMMVRLTTGCLLVYAGAAWGQQPSFDAATVKMAGPVVPGPQGSTGGPGTPDPGRFSTNRATLSVLLTTAYGVGNDQIIGPQWLTDFSESHVYAVTATMPPTTTKEQFRLMLQNLLTERFHLSVHHEMKDFPGYDLVVSSAGKLREWDPNGPPPPDGMRDANGFPILRPGAKSVLSLQMKSAEAGGSPGASLVRASYRETMGEFAAGLGFLIRSANGGTAGEPAPRVNDKTGLSGIYEFHLMFSNPGASATPGASEDPVLSGPTLFSALSDQLGLKLQKAKSVQVDVIVVDKADPVPTEN